MGASTQRVLAHLKQQQSVKAVQFAPTGERIATISESGRLQIWDVASRELVSSIETKQLGDLPGRWQLAWSPDGKTIATAALDGSTCGMLQTVSSPRATVARPEERLGSARAGQARGKVVPPRNRGLPVGTVPLVVDWACCDRRRLSRPQIFRYDWISSQTAHLRVLTLLEPSRPDHEQLGWSGLLAACGAGRCP